MALAMALFQMLAGCMSVGAFTVGGCGFRIRRLFLRRFRGGLHDSGVWARAGAKLAAARLAYRPDLHASPLSPKRASFRVFARKAITSLANPDGGVRVGINAIGETAALAPGLHRSIDMADRFREGQWHTVFLTDST